MINKVSDFIKNFASSKSAASQEKELLKKIRQGFENQEFKMYLQFVVDNKTKDVVSAEALARWETAEGVVPPGVFIGAMEKAGIVSLLDYYMFEKACAKLAKWHGTDMGNLTISCNFTRITISEVDFVEKIRTIAEKYEFNRHQLLLEITEDSMEKNLEIAMKNILKVKQLGFVIALDDIGSGYTSLISLCEYPIDVAKIDRDILLMTKQERGKKLFLGIISLAHYLSLKVVCEGVETPEQNALVSDSDCDYIQGWYYAKALPEEQADAFVETYRKENL